MIQLNRISLIVLLILIHTTAQAQIISSFDTDKDGWTALNGITGDPVYISTGGNPGGFIQASDGISGVTTYMVAPAKFSGNRISSYRQFIRFDLKVALASTVNGGGDVKIFGGGISLVKNISAPLPNTTTWTTYSLQIDETQGWRVGSTTGPIATKQQVMQVLSSVTAIHIGVEYSLVTGTTDKGSLDNVILEQRILPPPPAITSFTPASGKPGTTVTINGNDFDPTSANNIVYFGSVKATVTNASTNQLTVTLPDGVLYGPITIINNTTGLANQSAQPFTPTFDDGGRIIAASFDPKADLTLGSANVTGLKLADLDGDGWNDIVVSESGNTISIFRNLGTGGDLTSASFAPKITLTGGGNQNGLFIADADGDGKLDIMTGYSDGFAMSFVSFRNTSSPASISFEGAELWPGLVYSGRVSGVIDVDGDGLIDIIGQHGNGSAAVDFWIAQNISTQGNIEFGLSVSYFGSATVDAGDGVNYGDLNNDGKPEMIIRYNFGSTFSIAQNTSTSGAISFASPFVFSQPSYGEILISDFNLDGKNDIAWKQGFSNDDIYIRLNSDSDGILAASDLTTQVILNTDLNYTGSLSQADINGDGKPDIIATDGAYFGVFENVYSGGIFNANAFVPAYLNGTIGAGLFALAPAAADLNGDSKPDIVVSIASTTPKTIAIFENKNVRAPAISINTVSPLKGIVGSTVTITGNHFSATPSENIVTFGHVKATVTSATKTQLTVIVPAGASLAKVSVTRDRLTSTYHLPFIPTFSAGVNFNNTHFAPPISFTLTSAGYDVDAGDINNDGKPDVIADVTVANAYAFRNAHSTGSISTTSLIPNDTLSSAPYPHLMDLDGDGTMDMLSGVGPFQNASEGTEINFNPYTYINPGGYYFNDFADFDLDGKIDFIGVNGNSVALVENRTTSGIFTNTNPLNTFGNAVSYSKPGTGGSVVVADFDNDGLPDFAATNPDTDNISIWKNSGAYRISTNQFIVQPVIVVGDNPTRIYKGDFNTDGKVDLLLIHGTGTTNTRITLLENQSTVGSISFSSPVNLTNTSGLSVAHIADLDGDGKPEIITTSENGNRFSIFKNIHTAGALSVASFAAPFNTTVTAPRGIVTGDLNLDGKPEIILTRAAGLLVVYENLIANPTILSFTPSSGQAGTEVTITGTNFSTIPSENDVRFNGVRAYVTSSSSTTLTAIVPPNATTGRIAITVGINTTATSATDYTVIPFSCPPDPRTNGELDIAFNPLVQDPVTFTAVELQSTGKSIVAAPFVTINGASYEGILRFNSDGSIDNSFATSAIYYPNKWQMSVMPDDKILVSDIGTESYIRRLNADGSLDNTFNSPSYYASTIHAISYQQDGKVLFSIYDDQQGDNFIYRLNTNGTLDNSFTSIAGLQANVIIQLSDGKILIGGGLQGMTRLNTSGIIDNSFATLDAMDGTVTDMALQSDNKIIVIGSFFSFDGVPVNNIVRLQPNGAVDITFKSGQAFPFFAGLQLNTVKVLPNDKILIVGEFVTYNFVTRNRIIVLNSDGSLDCTFDAQAGPDSSITDAAIQTDGKILITGSFTNYESTPRNAFARVTYSSTFIGITQQPVNPNNVCEGGNYVLSTDATGTTNIAYKWQKYNTGTGLFEDLTDGANYAGVNTKNITISNVTSALAGDYRCMINGDLASTVYCNVATLTVNAKPADPVVTNAERCGPGSVTLAASGGAPGEFIWRTDPMASEPIQNENDPTYTTPDISATTTYYVAVANALCESNMVPVIATILSTPLAPTTTNLSNCGPGSLILQALGGTNGQYRWYDVATGGNALPGEINSTFTTPSLTATTTYYVSINNGSCESARTAAIASILAVPAKPTITANEPITAGVVQVCLIAITLSAPSGFTYMWSNGLTTQEITNVLPGNYSVVVTDASGCSSVASDVVQVVANTSCVNSPPVITTTTAQTFIGGKITIDLSDLISDPDGNLDASSLQVVGNATQKGGETSLTGFILEIDYASAKFSGKDLVTIRVCDLLNVCFEASIEIEVIGDITVYNGISPNGDGKNDTWIIEYIDLFPDTQNNRVTIYNRWGDVVWEGSNYDNTSKVFTGINKNGGELSTGSYFYKIEFFDGGRESITGYLSLKR